jgi:hypothetical protein
MSDAELPLPRPTPPPKSWRVTFPQGEPRAFSADGFRVDGGALVLLLPAGCVAAYAPGQWLTVESLALSDLETIACPASRLPSCVSVAFFGRLR